MTPDLTNHCSFLCLDTDQQWKAERAKLVTGSLVASVMGLSPFVNREQVVEELHTEPTFSDDALRRMWWGSFSEQHNMTAFSAITGLRTHPHNGLYRSKASPWLGATLDGFVRSTWLDERPDPLPLGGLKATPYWASFWDAWDAVDIEVDGLIEMKQTSRVGDWSKRVPEYYWAQVQCGLYVTGLTWAVCCAKIGADDMRFHIVFPDYGFHEEMVEETRKFAEEVGIYG